MTQRGKKLLIFTQRLLENKLDDITTIIVIIRMLILF